MMAEIPDNLGRMGRFDKADVESIAASLKAAVGKAVDYASGKAKTTSDEMQKQFDELVEAMEELEEGVKDNLESTKKFVEEVKGAADSVERMRSATNDSARATESLAAAQREQTNVLRQILKSQQRAMADKAAKFTSGGTALASTSPRRPALKEMGFRPRGTDRIPAMLSPGEFVVNRRGARGNEPLLNRINRGYMSGGKVKPAYLAGGTDPYEFAKGKGIDIKRLDATTVELLIGPKVSPADRRTLIEMFKEMGIEAETVFAEEYEKNLRRSLSRWVTGIAQAFTGHDPWQAMFEGSVKDITEFRVQMRQLAFESEGITGNFREAQAEFAKIGDNIAGRTGKSVTAFQKAYMSNARKGFKDQKAAMKTVESGLKLSTLIGSETQATATLFADWHRELGLGATQMERMANNMQTVARTTGVTGDELIGVMKSSEGILKNLRNQGTLTTNAARNVTQAMAEFKKMGFEEEGQRILTAMSSWRGFQSADQGTKTLLQISAGQAGMDVYDVMHGGAIQDPQKMGQMAGGLKDWMAGLIGVDSATFDIDELTEDQRKRLSLIMESQGTSLEAADAQIKVLTKGAAGLTGTLSEFDKASKDVTATQEQRKLAEKKMNDALLAGSMDVVGSVQQAAEKYKDMNLAELSSKLSEDNKFSRDFKTSSKDVEAIAPYLSDALKGQFGLKGDQAQMAAQISAMDMQKQISLRYMAGAEQLDKAMKAEGKGSKDFTKQMNAALAKGDMKRVRAIEEEMKAARSELQTEEAQKVDPMVELERTMNKLNETMRKTLSPLFGGFIDAIGGLGMFLMQAGFMLTAAYGTIGKDFIGALTSGGLGTSIMEGMGTFFGTEGLGGMVVSGFAKALGPAMILLGGIKGVMEASDAKRTKVEGGILGALTGGAKTGSFITGRYGDEAGAGDKALGVMGAAAWGASAGAALTMTLGGTDFGASIVIGAVIGAFAEIIKIITEGTDILQDIFTPIQVVVDYVYFTFKNIYDVVAVIFTLDFGRVFGAIFNQIGSTIALIPRLILGVIQSIFIGLPKLILRALSMIWELPRMMMESIKNALASMVDNAWVGPIFATLSSAFNAIYDGFMAIWTPISQIFSGIYTVFNDLGKALFGAGEGGSILSGIMWVLQKAVWGLSYVISWLLSPVILVAKALGGVLWVVGKIVQGIIWPFQYLYDVLVGHSIVPDLVFGIIKFFAMLPIRIIKGLFALNVMIVKSFLRIPFLIWDGVSTAMGWLRDNLMKSWAYAKSLFSPSAWLKSISNLGTYVYEGFKSALQGVWDWIKSWIPGLGTVGKVASGAWEGVKSAGSTAWEGLKAAGSYLNPFSYFKQGTKRIDKPGLGMLHEGEMVVPKTMVDKIAAMGSGAFGSISSFVRGKGGGGAGEKGLIGSIGEKISGLGGVFKSCCPKDAVEEANDAMGKIPAAVADAMGEVDDRSLFGRMKKQFTRATSYTNKFFKPLTTGFIRARKRGEGFIGSITKGLNSQYMDMTKGGIGGNISGGMDWLSKSIFGDKEGKDTKRGIFQKIKEGIFGGKEGEDTKKGILGIVKEGLFGSGDDVKKGLFQIAKEGLFGKEGEGGGILSWARDKIFGQRMKDGEAGPGKPGLLQSAKNTASSLWEITKKKMEISTEDGLINGVKNAAKSMYGKAKSKLFGSKLGKGEMGPERPGLIDKVKGGAVGLYEKAKGKFFGKDASEAVSEAGKADQATKGNLSGIKEKMTNIAEGIKQFSGAQVLFGSLNLIPASAGLTAMIPGSLGARMLQNIDGEKLKTSLEGLSKGVASFGSAKVLLGAGAMLVVGIASLGLIPAIPMFALLGAVGPLVEGGLKALGNGLTALGQAAANPYTWLGVLLLAAINIALIPLAYALSLISPVIEAFGVAIKSAFEGAGALLKGVGESIGLILKEITISKALALGVAAAGIAALGVAMMVFAGGGFIASWIDFFSGDGLFNKIMALAAMGPNLALAANSVDVLGGAFKRFAQNKGGGWKEWLLGSDGVIAGFKELSKVGTPEFQASADSMHKMAEALEKIQNVHAIPAAGPGDATTATAGGAGTEATSGVEPVHLRDITGTILRDKAGSGGNRLQSDELSRMEEASHKQVTELEQIRQGIQELVSLMRPRGASIAGESGAAGPSKTKDPRRPVHAARFGKMKYGKVGGLANRSYVNNGEV